MAENGGQKTAECYDKEILVAARERRWKSGRSGGGGGDRDTDESWDGEGGDGYWDDGKETGDAQVGE